MNARRLRSKTQGTAVLLPAVAVEFCNGYQGHGHAPARAPRPGAGVCCRCGQELKSYQGSRCEDCTMAGWLGLGLVPGPGPAGPLARRPDSPAGVG